MPNFVALFRGVNMGGHKKVPMHELRALAVDIGLKEPQTLLQSGNMVFSSPRSAPTLENLLEMELEARLMLKTTVLVRTGTEWAKIIAANPFGDAAARDPSHLALMALKHKPSRKSIDALRASISGREYFEARGRELYAFFPDGFAGTKFTTALIDRKLGTVVTARNWNTVLKIADALS